MSRISYPSGSPRWGPSRCATMPRLECFHMLCTLSPMYADKHVSSLPPKRSALCRLAYLAKQKIDALLQPAVESILWRRRRHRHNASTWFNTLCPSPIYLPVPECPAPAHRRLSHSLNAAVGPAKCCVSMPGLPSSNESELKPGR